MKKRNIFAFIGLLLLVFLIKKVGLGDIFKTINNANKSLFCLSLLIFFPISAIQTKRWMIFTKINNGGVVSFKKFFPLYLEGLFYGLITPGKIGTFYRITLLKDEIKLNNKVAIKSVFFDRLSDLFSLVLLASAGIIFLLDIDLALYFILGVWLLFIILFMLIVEKEKILKIGIVNELDLKYGKPIKELPKLYLMIVPFFLGLVSWILIYFQAYLVALSLNIHIGFKIILLLAPISTLIGLVPITISGFGTRDAAFIALTGLYGIKSSEALNLSLIAYFVNAVFPGIIGGLISLFNLFKKSNV